uniref:Tc1-like transposase DDE domain-containing protein n=1 Tax=Pygocentrus nattereri TaxID=42514 RepID=A0AAR2K5U3_PYGNA
MFLNVQLQGISSSTVYNIIKRFRESGEISASKWQGRRPTLNVRDLRSLRRHCIKKTTSFCNGYYHMGSGTLQKTIVSEHSSSLHLQVQVKTLPCKSKAIYQQHLCSDESTFLIVFGNHGRRVLRAKEEKDCPDCFQRKVQKPASLMVWGCVSAHGMSNMHICEGTINAKRYIQVLEQHMLPSKQRLFQGRPCLFQQDNAKPHSARVTTAWLHSKRVRVLDWPACSPDLSPIENVWCVMKHKIRQLRPRTVEQLKLYIKQEWERIPPTKLQQLVSLVPKRLLSVVKRKVM